MPYSSRFPRMFVSLIPSGEKNIENYTESSKNTKNFTFPQNVQVYFECWVISIFFTILRNEAPYRVPYLPTTPTFCVRFAWWNNQKYNFRIILIINLIISYHFCWSKSRWDRKTSKNKSQNKQLDKRGKGRERSKMCSTCTHTHMHPSIKYRINFLQIFSLHVCFWIELFFLCLPISNCTVTAARMNFGKWQFRIDIDLRANFVLFTEHSDIVETGLKILNLDKLFRDIIVKRSDVLRSKIASTCLQSQNQCVWIFFLAAWHTKFN